MCNMNTFCKFVLFIWFYFQKGFRYLKIKAIRTSIDSHVILGKGIPSAKHGIYLILDPSSNVIFAARKICGAMLMAGTLKIENTAYILKWYIIIV